MYLREGFGIGATRIAIPALGASAFPFKFTPPAGMVGAIIKYASGNTLEILPNAIAGASIGGATAGGLGYILGTTESYVVNGPATFYLAATGATTVAQVSIHFSSGASLA